MNRKTLFACVIFISLFSFFSCSNKTVTYETISKSDWLLRMIQEDVKVTFNLKNSTVKIVDTEKNYFKDPEKNVMENRWYYRGTFEGNPEADGIVNLSITEYSFDDEDWYLVTDDVDILIFDANQIEIKDASFYYDDEKYILVQNSKEHKVIDKQISEGKKLIQKINELDSLEKNEKKSECFEKLNNLLNTLVKYRNTEIWTIFDESDYYDMSDFVIRYNFSENLI